MLVLGQWILLRTAAPVPADSWSKPGLLTGEEDHQRSGIDDGFGEEPRVVSICASRHQMEIHGVGLSRQEGEVRRGEEEARMASSVRARLGPCARLQVCDHHRREDGQI